MQFERAFFVFCLVSLRYIGRWRYFTWVLPAHHANFGDGEGGRGRWGWFNDMREDKSRGIVYVPYEDLSTLVTYVAKTKKRSNLPNMVY